jgi:hypothetical protein
MRLLAEPLQRCETAKRASWNDLTRPWHEQITID